MFKHTFGETGHMAEEEFLGSVDSGQFGSIVETTLRALRENPEKLQQYEDALAKIKKGIPEYDKFNLSLEIVKACRSFEPTLPIPEYAYNLRKSVVRKLQSKYPQLNIGEDNVLYYTTCSKYRYYHGDKSYEVQTPADRFHGVDAFFEITSPCAEGETVLITIDGSMKRHKDNLKANILTTWPETLDSKIDPNGFDDFVDAEANKVVNVFWREATRLSQFGSALNLKV